MPQCQLCHNVSQHNRTKYSCKLGLHVNGKQVWRDKAPLECDKYDHYFNHQGPGIPLDVFLGGTPQHCAFK